MPNKSNCVKNHITSRCSRRRGAAAELCVMGGKMLTGSTNFVKEKIKMHIFSLIITSIIIFEPYNIFYSFFKIQIPNSIKIICVILFIISFTVLIWDSIEYILKNKWKQKREVKYPKNYRKKFDVLWGTDNEMYCLKCCGSLISASKKRDKGIFFCAECGKKHFLNDEEGNPMTKNEAINKIKVLKSIT